jgi:hypothetical protein
MINTGPGPKESMMKKKSMSAKAAVHAHEAAMHPGKPKTKLAKLAEVQRRVTNERLMSSGRNMARVAEPRGEVNDEGQESAHAAHWWPRTAL